MSCSKRRQWFLVTLIPFFFLIGYFSRAVLTPFALAFFLAYAINPMVEFLEQKGARRDYAVLTVYLVLTLLLLLVFWLILPRLFFDLNRIAQSLPMIFLHFQAVESRWTVVYWKLPGPLQKMIIVLTQRGEVLIQRILLHAIQGLLGFFSHIYVAILVPLLAYYISRDYPRFKKNILLWLERYLGKTWTHSFLKTDGIFHSYIRGQFLDMVSVGFFIGIGLKILGMEGAFLLGVLAGIFNIIPYFGPIIGLAPAFIFALLHSPWTALYVVVLFTVVNQLEAIWLAPRIFSTELGLHPITVIYLILFGGQIFGLLGMIFAIPIGATCIALLRSIYEIYFNNPKGATDIKIEDDGCFE